MKNSIYWIVQENLVNNINIKEIAYAINNTEAHLLGVNVIPFVDNIKLPFDIFPADNAIPYGSTKLIKIAKKLNFKGLFFNDNFNVSSWLDNRNDMLNYDSIVTTIGEACKEFISAGIDENTLYFIRPEQDLKVFAGRVTSVNQIINYKNIPDFNKITFDDSLKVSFCPIKNIFTERRWFIVNRKIVSGSIYKYYGQLLSIEETDENIIEEAQKKADEWLPHETCVMDLADTDEGLKVVEFNCFNASGFYKCDINKIVKSVNEYMDNL